MRSFLSRIVIIGSLTLLASCSQEIIGGLSQKDMMDAQILLERAGISVSFKKAEDGRYAMVGDASEQGRALALLTENGLPRNRHPSIAEVFPGTGFVVTPFEQKARLSYALEQQLSQTLSDIDGVAEARVHVVLPEDNGRGLVREQSRASILIKYREDADIAAIESKSRALVVNGVRGLSFEDVSVVSSPLLGSVSEQSVDNGPIAETASSAGSAQSWLSMPQFDFRSLLIAAAALLAAGAAAILLLPQRKES
ncbi:type III secretion system inner membrane ring lipoprotein SctJ [Rhizobium helianthi]|uniref:Lipoprotein n=1 Tax=Rhizobium helianthi TaxID=1132695 RepID=A0ABW4M7X9_9HYPH